MKRRPSVPKGYAEAWARLFTRSPAEIEEERLARMPAPAPRTPNAQEGDKSGAQRTQAGRVGPIYQSAKGERKS